METIDQYTIYCTAEQTKKALELGAPIEFQEDASHDDGKSSINPTAEQMIGRLEECEEIDEIAPMKRGEVWVYVVYMIGLRSDIESPEDISYPSRKEATLAAIDAALDYLIKNSPYV